jgi:solute carrier family 25 phosphate transporter 23/24/25/41
VQALGQLGVRSTRGQAARMIRSIDRNNDDQISWEEFHAAFELVPLASLQAVANAWSSLSQLDIGSDLSPLLPNPDLKIWQTVIAGGCAGVMSRSVTAPLERIRLAAQTGTLHGSMASAFARIYQQEGLRGLFRGNAANCLRVFPTGGITLTTYLSLLKLTPADGKMDAMEPVYRVMCAGVAAAVGNTMTYPLDVVRARMTLPTAGGPKYEHILASFRSIRATEGIKGLYRGIHPTLLAVVPFVAIQQTTVDTTKGLAAEMGWTPPTAPLLMMCGASAGLLAQTVVYPLDVLRRRMQLGPQAAGHVTADRTWLAIQAVVRKEGVASLFAGIVPTYVKAIPTAMMGATVCVSLVEHFKGANKAQALSRPGL